MRSMLFYNFTPREGIWTFPDGMSLLTSSSGSASPLLAVQSKHAASLLTIAVSVYLAEEHTNNNNKLKCRNYIGHVLIVRP